MRRIQAPLHRASLAAALGVVLILGGGVRGQGGHHGDATVPDQLARLAELGPPSRVPPHAPGIDPAFWARALPADNPGTEAQVALGRRLYFETALSRDDTVSCATCHDVTRGFTDQRPVSEGIGGKLGRRNAPTTLNLGLVRPLFWDGRAQSLEHQAGMPITNPIEMGMPDEESVVRKLAALPDYPAAFQEAYGRPVNFEDLKRAIAAFERTLNFLDAPFDAWLAGDESAISADAKEGFRIFNGQGRCVTCHPFNPSNPLGSDLAFHNIGVSARHRDFEGLARTALAELDRDSSEAALDRLALATDLSELGRFVVTRNRSDIGAFRTPILRNIGMTAPYMHDGSLHSLWDVMDHYNKGGEDNPFLSGSIEALALTEKQIDQVVEFLFTLTDRRFAAEQALIREQQRARAASVRPFRDDDLAHRRRLGFESRALGTAGEER
jgi:cytochrome c peroxidase